MELLQHRPVRRRGRAARKEVVRQREMERVAPRLRRRQKVMRRKKRRRRDLRGRNRRRERRARCVPRSHARVVRPARNVRLEAALPLERQVATLALIRAVVGVLTYADVCVSITFLMFAR